MTFTFTGIDELIRYVNRFERQIKPELLEVAGETLVDLTRERFTTGTDPYRKPWPISARAQAQSGQTLRDKGVLANSFTHAVTGPEDVLYGTNVFYGIVHQEGRVIEPRRRKVLRFNVNGKPVFAHRVVIPARPMVPDDRGDPPEYDRELKATLEAALTRLTP